MNQAGWKSRALYRCSTIRSRFHETLRRIASADASPARLGLAIGVGVFFACTPFFGLQLVLALLVAWPLRLNKVAVTLGTQFSFPPLIPFIVLASVNIGEFLLRHQTLSLTRSQIAGVKPLVLAQRFGIAWLVGGVVFGIVAGTLVGAAVTVAANWNAARRKNSNVGALHDDRLVAVHHGGTKLSERD